jgi:hypothetical protein
VISLLQALKNILQKPFSKEIKFSLMEKYIINGIKNQSDFWLEPLPAMKKIPEWYKEMKTYTQGINTPTVKKCPPVLEMYKHGYYILNSVEINISRVDNFQGKVDYKVEYPPNYGGPELIAYHARPQVWKMPLIDRWHTNHAMKYNNPFLIKTPPGYSTMFLNPTINDINDEYYGFEAIVDTDNWHEVNFPFIINWSKIPVGKDYILKRNHPIILAIPFKRTNFTSVVSWKDKDMFKRHMHQTTNRGQLFSNFYKNLSERIKFK